MMVVLEVPEGSGDHHVTVVTVGPQLFDHAGVPPAHAKVTALKRQRVSIADGPLGRSGTGLVPR